MHTDSQPNSGELASESKSAPVAQVGSENNIPDPTRPPVMLKRIGVAQD